MLYLSLLQILLFLFLIILRGRRLKKYITILILYLNAVCLITGCISKNGSDNTDKIIETKENLIETETNAEDVNIQDENIISYADTIEIPKTEHPLFPVYIDGSYDYIDIDGNVITDYNFEKAEFFRGGRASVKLNGKYGFIDTNGCMVIDCVYSQSGAFFNDGLCNVTVDGEKWGYIDN